MEIKKCSKCNEIKDISNFRAYIRWDKNYYEGQCKSCKYNYKKEWRKLNPEKVKEESLTKYYKDKENNPEKLKKAYKKRWQLVKSIPELYEKVKKAKLDWKKKSKYDHLYAKKIRMNLTDVYIKGLAKKQGKRELYLQNPILIDVHRILIKIKGL